MTEDEGSRLVDRVAGDVTRAMKAKDPATLAPLRMLKAALANRRVEKGKDLDEAEAVKVVASLVKQRRDAQEQFYGGGRQDLADHEAAEIRVLQTYLPPAADPAQVEAAIQSAIEETGATASKDLGRVMKVVMAKLAGRGVDGKTVNRLVSARLGGG